MGKYLADSYDAALRENAELKALVTDAQEELRKCQQDAIQLQARLAKAEAALRPLADIPLEDFGKERKPDYPLMGWNNHTIYVRDVLAARAFLAADSASDKYANLLDLTPVGPGRTVDDALSDQPEDAGK